MSNHRGVERGKGRAERRWLAAALIAVAAAGFVAVFSYTTSPFYAVYAETPDSPIFQIIGKYWAQGVVPYTGLWDLKGPYIFLVNAVGYALTGTPTGVFLVQTVFMAFTLAFLYRLYRLRLSRAWSVAMVAVSLMQLSYVYEGGNLTEEYLLPLLVLSFYFIGKWISSGQRLRALSGGRFAATLGGVAHYEGLERGAVAHPPRWAMVYGMVLGLSLMSRLTNALAMCGAVAVISVVLIRRGCYKNLLQNVAMFVAGFAVSTIPFFVYFGCHHVLKEMWNATFVYSLTYAGNAEKDILATGIHYFVLSYVGSILLLAVVVVRAVRTRRMAVADWLWLLSALLPFVWFCQGNGFGHYGMTVFPLFAIAMMQIGRLGDWSFGCLGKLHGRVVFLAVVAVVAVGCASKVRFAWQLRSWHNRELAQTVDFLRQTPDIDYSSFVAYNCDPNLYLALDVRPAVAFFSLQDFAVSRNERLGADVAGAFREAECRWILLREEPGVQPTIGRMLREDYHVARTQPSLNLTLYEKVDSRK